ncbi:hypothetical protein OB905_00065 [Halobacteria archaeon AArc-dxtr1]|nr:hypothetical protein [Halobacteria archaeon AArc-dxtr1]
MSDDPELESLLGDAEDAIASLEEHGGDVEALSKLDDKGVETLLGDVETLATAVEELADLFETIDPASLPEAIDADELREAVNTEEVPDALSGEGDVFDAVDLSHVVSALDLLEVWDAADIGDLWEDTRELEAAVSDLADDEDGGVIGEVAASVTDEGGDGLTGDDGLTGEGGLTDDGGVMGDDGLLDDAGDLVDDVDPMEALGDVDVASDPEVYQVLIQQGAMEGIDAFRDALLKTHGKFERLYEVNREKMRMQDRSTNSRNPTATSTMPVDRRDLGGGARHSTVPRQVRYSTAPTRKRIYGRRFEIERKRRGYD